MDGSRYHPYQDVPIGPDNDSDLNSQTQGETAMRLALKTDPPPLREDAYGILRVSDTRVTLGSLVELSRSSPAG